MRGPEMELERWLKVPGWRLEVSDHGRVRNLAGRVLELYTDGGAYRVRYTQSDVDPTARRMFTVANLVLHVFDGAPLKAGVEYLDGDQYNCRRDNLKALERRTRPGGRGLKPLIPPTPNIIEHLDREIWRKVPGYRAYVSNMGRAWGPFGFFAGTRKHQRARVRLLDDLGQASRSLTLASVIQGTFRDLPLDAPARPLNGDVSDSRLSNLDLGRPAIRKSSKRYDPRWTRKQDNALRQVTTFADAARMTGHTQHYCRKRMRLLGIKLALVNEPRSGISPTLDFRDLTNIDRYIAILHRAGVGDREINLGLRIIRPRQGEFEEAYTAKGRCIETLLDAGCKRPDVAEAVGHRTTTLSAWLVRLGRQEKRQDGWLTKAGPIDERDGEEWREIPGTKQIVSNHGRVATAAGFLMSPARNTCGRLHISLMTTDGVRITRTVARLVLEAFRPELTSRKARYLNGDQTDNRLDNLVAKTLPTTGAETEVVVVRRGNLSNSQGGPVMGSVPRSEPLWAQANKIVPRYFDPHVREDLISDIVMMVMEGRAATVAEAFGPARTEHNRLMGTYDEQSLNAPMGEGKATRIDRLTTDGVFIRSGRVPVRRLDGQ